MKKLPDAELELMMIIWDAKEPISRIEIENRMDERRDVVPSTILSLLSRLEDRGFISKEKHGKINYYNALVDKEPYLKETGKSILKRMFGGSLSNFAAALYDGEELSDNDIAELQEFIDSKTAQK
ncbi:MAG: BlaI/MecI/CopY family transcriptional regulator [Lachnospiraceae bacterium]|nr:BlaI/MecI/CopY family transcriptional regulator [Lachnospiraceae bacterium]